MSVALHRKFVLCVFGLGEASASSLSEWRLNAHFAGYFHKNTEFVSLNSVCKGLHIVFLIIWMTKLVSRCLFSGICSATRVSFFLRSFSLALFPFYTVEPWFYMEFELRFALFFVSICAATFIVHDFTFTSFGSKWRLCNITGNTWKNISLSPFLSHISNERQFLFFCTRFFFFGGPFVIVCVKLAYKCRSIFTFTCNKIHSIFYVCKLHPIGACQRIKMTFSHGASFISFIFCVIL